MRHRYSGRKLNKSGSHKRAMFRNMTASLVEHELIKTTLPKAKELRRFAEPFITLAKEDSVANRRLAFDRLRNKATVGKLFTDLGPRFLERPGGYVRILKCGNAAVIMRLWPTLSWSIAQLMIWLTLQRLLASKFLRRVAPRKKKPDCHAARFFFVWQKLLRASHGYLLKNAGS